MASLFRARRRRSPEDDGEDGDRCGSGRAKRRCLSPEEGARTPDEAAEEEGRCRWWFSAFLGAAKRVSSVLCPDEQVSEEEEEGSEAGTSSNVGNIGNDYGVEGGGAYYHGTSNPQMIQPTNQDVDNSGGTSAPKGRGSVAAKDREPRALDTFSIRRLKKMLREELANPRVPKRRRINLVKIKGQKKEQTSSTNGKPAAKKQSPGESRLHKDIAELNLPKTTEMSFPQGKEDLMNFEVSVRPNEGYYVGGKFAFTFQVPSAYPHEPPKVKCKTKVYHPNIDLEGNVGLNILREDWKPVLNISTIVYGLNLLFSQPNEEDPLNHEAAAVLRDDPPKFAENVERAMARGFVDENQSLGVCNA